jgi:hypothetical protein
MNLYYFQPNTYGTEWLVMAESREEAIAAVKAYVRKDRQTDLEREMALTSWPKHWPPREEYLRRAQEGVERAVAEVDMYVDEAGISRDEQSPSTRAFGRIRVFGRGEVVQTEIC